MAEDRIERPEEPVPPAGEPVHLPGPSYLPVLTAAGISLAIVGVVINYVLTVIGAVIAVIAIVRWVRETREEIAELPLEH
jgi:hypothetical protein